ncbi:MAG TPA: hypothetical protein VME01_10850, partial [Solirubrobacteraceae bacterium]|nr:hypothetical protein [Solirubrobacteraceae bacterium]
MRDSLVSATILRARLLAGVRRVPIALITTGAMIMLSGCGVSAGGGAHGSAREVAQVTVASFPNREVTLFYRRIGLQVVGTARSQAGIVGGSFDPRLELRAGAGGWRDVTPKQVRRSCAKRCQFEFENAFFLNRSFGWVTVWNVITLRDDVYGTTDGGREWRLELGTEHTDNAGAQTVVWFINRRDGWVAALQPTGPAVTAWRTRDGGRTWRQLPQNRAITKAHRIESWSTAPFEFISPTVGYAADHEPNAFGLGGALARTTDAGWIWRQQTVQLPAWSRQQPPTTGTYPFYELPTFSTIKDAVLPVLLPATRRHAAAMAFYTTTDQGQHWKLKAALPVNTASFRPPQQTFTLRLEPLVSIVTPSIWWVASPGRPAASRGDAFRIT